MVVRATAGWMVMTRPSSEPCGLLEHESRGAGARRRRRRWSRRGRRRTGARPRRRRASRLRRRRGMVVGGDRAVGLEEGAAVLLGGDVALVGGVSTPATSPRRSTSAFHVGFSARVLVRAEGRDDGAAPLLARGDGLVVGQVVHRVVLGGDELDPEAVEQFARAELVRREGRVDAVVDLVGRLGRGHEVDAEHVGGARTRTRTSWGCRGRPSSSREDRERAAGLLVGEVPWPTPRSARSSPPRAACG